MNLLPLTQRIAVLVTMFTSASVALLVQTTIDAQLSNVVNVTSTYCGNGIIESLHGEQCDDGSDNGTEDSYCAQDCKMKEFCGNGVIEGNEECDDGLSNGYDSCTTECEFTDTDSDDDYGESTSSKGSGSSCGDAVVQGDEQCDDGNGDNTDNCTNRCRYAACGDGHVQPNANEVCDDGDANGGPNSTCNKDCKRKNYCGDGKKDGKEECDDGNTNNVDNCTNTCRKGICGDGIVQEMLNEQCDDGNTRDDDTCNHDCRRTFCGDGVVQGELGEECDKGSIENGLQQSGCTANCKKIQAVSSSSSSSLHTSSSSIPTGIQPAAPQQDDDDEGDEIQEEQTENIQEQQQKESEDRIEQLEKQREEMKRKAAEAMKNARKMREEAQQKAEAVEKNKETPTQTSDAEPESDLRCFDSDGNLTADRDKCDIEKEKLLQPDVQISEDEAREKLRTKLLGDNIAEKRRAELLETMSNARERLIGLSEAGNHTPQIDGYLNDSVAWLERGIEYFSQGPRSIQEIQSMVAPVKQLLAQTTGLLQQEKKLPDTARVDINPIITKTERLILKFRESIIALANAGVVSDPETIEHYSRAAEQFVAIREDCAQDELQCGRLREVLDILKLIQEPVMNDLGENPEVLQAVEAKFSE